MKGIRIGQEKSFEPIHITLETREAAEKFWDIILFYADKGVCLETTDENITFANEISNWFSEKATM